MKKRISVFLTTIILFNFYFYSFYFEKKVNSKNVNNVLDRAVYPIGKLVGLKLYTNGVLVVGMSEIEDENGKYIKPYDNSNIKEGDLIKTINGIEINNVKQLVDFLKNNKDNVISIKYQRENDEIYSNIKPVKAKSGEYMIGLWVRDAAAGVGTITYYDDENNRFAALGHGIDDVDTGKLLSISNGELVTSKVISIVKGESKKPGEIRATIDDGVTIGSVEKNTNIGVYGNVTNKEFFQKFKLNKLLVANRKQIQVGNATLLCQISDDKTDKYEIEIKRIFKNNHNSNKSMLFKVTDERLLEKTGGIIPGMSGAPIIQNGKLIGAVTNVLLNDPTQGYAIFADMMF